MYILWDLNSENKSTTRLDHIQDILEPKMTHKVCFLFLQHVLFIYLECLGICFDMRLFTSEISFV